MMKVLALFLLFAVTGAFSAYVMQVNEECTPSSLLRCLNLFLKNMENIGPNVFTDSVFTEKDFNELCRILSTEFELCTDQLEPHCSRANQRALETVKKNLQTVCSLGWSVFQEFLACFGQIQGSYQMCLHNIIRQNEEFKEPRQTADAFLCKTLDFVENCSASENVCKGDFGMSLSRIYIDTSHLLMKWNSDCPITRVPEPVSILTTTTTTTTTTLASTLQPGKCDAQSAYGCLSLLFQIPQFSVNSLTFSPEITSEICSVAKEQVIPCTRRKTSYCNDMERLLFDIIDAAVGFLCHEKVLAVYTETSDCWLSRKTKAHFSHCQQGALQKLMALRKAGAFLTATYIHKESCTIMDVFEECVLTVECDTTAVNLLDEFLEAVLRPVRNVMLCGGFPPVHVKKRSIQALESVLSYRLK